jgi:DNA-binding response OmpR family regulator
LKKGSVLVVEDDARTQELLKSVLEDDGFSVRAVPNLFRARGEVTRMTPDLVLLDRNLPDGDGEDFCKELRSDAHTRDVPVIFLTTRSGKTDEVVGLKLGADDYLTKPFTPDVLLARIETVLRRVRAASAPASAAPELAAPSWLSLDLERHECKVDGKRIDLWPKEFELLVAFLEKPGKLLTRAYLSERVWGHEYPGGTRAIDIAVQRLRKKLLKRGALLETVRGYGFKLNA